MTGRDDNAPPSTTDRGWPVLPPTQQPPSTLAAVRSETRAGLAAYPEATVTDALLVADVLINDAFRSGRTLHQLYLHDQSPYLRIEVTSAPTTEPPQHPANTEGRARIMLEELTHTWGIERGEHLVTAWAELPVIY